MTAQNGVAAPAGAGTRPVEPVRIHFLDNLRTFIILLVVVLHCGVVYESSGIGAIFWIVDDPATNDFVGLLNLVLDIFLMPTMFLISGYTAPMSLTKRDPAQFVLSRIRRLMLPWLIAVLVLMPLYKVIFLASRGLPQEPWTSYFHFSNGLLSQSWLWFLPVLFLFDLLYAGLAKLKLAPRNLSVLSFVTVGILVAYAASLLMDLGGLAGWTKNAFVNFQNERMPLYFLCFLFGSLAYHQSVFADRPRGWVGYTAVNVLAWIPILGYGFLVILPIVAPGKHIAPPLFERMLYWAGFYLSLVALMYLSIETFRRYFNSAGRLWSALNRNSYSVYIIHVVVLGAFAWLLLAVGISSMAKYLALCATTYVVSNLLISAYRAMRNGLADRSIVRTGDAATAP